jgi:hypothetical protein
MVKILISIEERLIRLRSGHFGQRDGNRDQVFMPILVLAGLLLSCELYSAVNKLNPV